MANRSSGQRARFAGKFFSQPVRPFPARRTLRARRVPARWLGWVFLSSKVTSFRRQYIECTRDYYLCRSDRASRTMRRTFAHRLHLMPPPVAAANREHSGFAGAKTPERKQHTHKHTHIFVPPPSFVNSSSFWWDVNADSVALARRSCPAPCEAEQTIVETRQMVACALQRWANGRTTVADTRCERMWRIELVKRAAEDGETKVACGRRVLRRNACA